MATLTKNVATQDGRANFTYRCVVTENSYDKVNNTSNVTITFSIAGPWAPTFYEWSTSYGIIVDGSLKKSNSSSPYISTSYVNLLTWTGNIAHNTDGSKSINIGVYLTNGSAYYLPVQHTSSAPLAMGSVTLTTIPRASSISSADNVTLGNKCSIKWTPASSAFKYKIAFSLGNWSHTTDFITPNTTSAYTYSGYTIPNASDLLDDIPNSTTGSMKAVLTTYNSSGTQIGSSSSKVFTVTVPSSIVPAVGTITLSPASINGNSVLIQGKNKLTISVSGCSAGTGSSIKSYTFSGPGISKTQTGTSVTVGPISNTGTLTYTVKVTDNRGRTASKTATITCYAYSSPYFKSFSAFRSNSSGTADGGGSYMNCTYNIGYSTVNNTNDITVKILYKKNSATSYSSTTALTDSKTTSGNKVLSSIAEDSTYTVYATVTDNYSGSSSTSVLTVFGAERIVNITPDGTGIAFGKMAENTKMLESKYKIQAPGLKATRDGRSNTTLNIAADNEHTGCFEYYIVKGGITGAPASDGHIMHCHWDNTGGYDSQLYMANATGELKTRGCNAGTWGNWRTVLDTSNCDYIVEQGVSDNFRYRKWNSGISEAWYRKELGQISLTTSKAAGVYSNDTYQGVDIALPSGLFNTPPVATGNVCSNGYTFCQVSTADANTIAYRIWSSYSSSPTDCVISIHLTGTWK